MEADFSLPTSVAEISEVAEKLLCHKAPCVDHLFPEVLKALGIVWLYYILIMINNVLHHEINKDVSKRSKT